MRAYGPDKTRIGWVGTGVMGLPMCRRLLEAGYACTVTTRTKAKAEPLLDAGAAWADTPRQVAEASDVALAIVGFPKDVREVFLGDDGLLAGAAAGSAVVDMTTSEPRLAEEIAAAAGRRDVHAVDAPVSGGDVGARAGTLSIMVGGDEEAVQALTPVLQVLGRTVRRQGPPGAGQHTKMVNQILIATNMVGVCEAMLYARKAGLDPTRVLESVGSGAAGSWSVTNLAPRMLDRDFEAGFYVEHFLKDLGIALAEARRLELALPGLALAEQLYQAVRAGGAGRKGTQALLLALERLSDV